MWLRKRKTSNSGFWYSVKGNEKDTRERWRNAKTGAKKKKEAQEKRSETNKNRSKQKIDAFHVALKEKKEFA